MKSRFRLVLSLVLATVLVAMCLAQRGAEEITSIRLRRTVCYGTCPAYDVKLSADGTVTYHGDAFVKRMGAYRARIRPADFRKLADKVVASGFYRMEDKYFQEVTDMPSQTLTVVSKAGFKSVYSYGELAPRALYTLQDQVDEVAAKATDWQKVKRKR